MKRSFTMVVERDPDSKWLVAEVVELPGCYTQAKDMRTLEANVQEAIRAYLKTAMIKKPVVDFVGTWRIEVSA
ncbi:MAG: type II toxin-antitoxin system HicB family antitoxin [Deltaproteobacteria bacterium]|nr:type II toxin-antitoxin system HicB family antitoxin [Deltaproteobacteria bacterium]